MGRDIRRGARTLLGALLVLVLVATAGACGGDDDDEGSGGEPSGTESDVSAQGDPVDGGSITVGQEAETNGWLPGTSNFANSGASVAYAIYDPLVRRDADGELRPYLAESIEPNDDLSQWTLKLRPGVMFHDGTPLNAEALKTIFDQYLTKPGANTAAALAGTQMTVVDDLTVTYQLDKPNSAFPDYLTLAAGWPFSPTAAAAAGADAPSHPVGTGPFVFDTWERDSRLVVKKNPNYWQEGLPHLDEIVFRPIPDEDTRLASLESGDIDVLQTLRQASVIRSRDIADVDGYEALGNTTGVNLFNTSKPPLDDVRVRKALVLAADQDQAIEVQGGSGVVPASSQLFNENDPYFSQQVADDWPGYDVDAAKESLEEYMNDPGRSDGKAVGEPVSFQYDCLPEPVLVNLAQIYQAFWEAIGVQVNLRQVEQATHISEALSGTFDVKCFRAGLDRDPYPVLHDAFTEGNLNFTRFTDPTITEDLDQLAASSDLDERKALVEEISSIVNENFPLGYHGATLSTLAARDVVKNVDGWTFPDGSEGSGVPGGTTMWGFVWTTE